MQIGSKEWSDLLIEGAVTLDIDLDPGQIRQFAIHAAELVGWNQKINITTITDPLEIAVKHFLDSLSVARCIPPDTILLDIGSGGGFPGLPLKVLMPSLSVTLIDTSRKKVNFLKHVIRALKLDNIDALHIRAQDLAKDPLFLKRYHVITSRALSSLKLFCTLAMPLLMDDGIILALKGDVGNDEMNELQGRGFIAEESTRVAGRRISMSVEKFRLPILNSHRSVIIIKPS
ncbi:MAG: 16S rRNA (guanine(527)-N(7))-methyltransferase RsmG [bacterium]|nr:16S rRNA (guanine(527)-N(7))-methyltransferase RsmG [bacterium]